MPKSGDAEVGTEVGAGAARRSRSRDKLASNALRLDLPAGRHSDGGGLYLFIRPGRKSWAFIYALNGRRREMGLGPAGDPPPGRPSDLVSLKAARLKAEALRAMVAAGVDPLEARDAAEAEEAARAQRQAAEAEAARVRAEAEAVEAARRAITFGQVADAFVRGGKVASVALPGLASELRNEKHLDQWDYTLGDTYCRKLRRRPVAEVNRDDVLAVLSPIWTKVPETASRLRGRIERVLDAAEGLGLRSGPNPARWKGGLATVLPKAQKLTRGHHAAMSWKDVPEFVAGLRLRAGVAALALEFLILTAARSGEIRGAVWSEIDQDAGIWTIPGKRMKAGKVHRVPLSPRALEILETIKPLTGGSGLIFPGNGGRQMSDMTLSSVLKRMEIEGPTVHGFRSAFRDWVFEATNYPADLAEAALAHVLRNQVEAAYRRGDALERRRQMMTDWSRYLDGDGGAEVVPFRRKVEAEA